RVDLGDALDGEALARMAHLEHLATGRDHRHAEAVQRHGGQRIDVSGRLALAQARLDLAVDGVDDLPEVEAADVELVLDRVVHGAGPREGPHSLPQAGIRRPPGLVWPHGRRPDRLTGEARSRRGGAGGATS